VTSTAAVVPVGLRVSVAVPPISNEVFSATGLKLPVVT
jgi:hypothetical protein